MIKLLLLVLAGAKIPELTDKNFAKKIENKNAFIVFFAPWCGHCKQMKPAFKQVAQDFAHESGVVVAQVDCTASGSQTCESQGINSYPTIRYFTRNTGHQGSEYQGSRSAGDMAQFINENLLPCNPATGNGCTDEARQFLSANKGRSREELIKELKAKIDEQSDIENQLADYKARIAELETESATRLVELGEEISVLRNLASYHDEL